MARHYADLMFCVYSMGKYLPIGVCQTCLGSLEAEIFTPKVLLSFVSSELLKFEFPLSFAFVYT